MAAFLPAAAPATCFEHANAYAGPFGASDLSVRPPLGRCARSLRPTWSERHTDRRCHGLATNVGEICGLGLEDGSYISPNKDESSHT